MTAIWARLAGSRAGGVVVTFAICVVVLAVVVGGGIDLASVITDRQRVQDVADAAALDGAKQLSVANVQGVETRTQQFAMTQLTEVGRRVTLTPSVTAATDRSTITVTIKGHRPSFFGDLLPAGGWTFGASATAAPMGRMPLCVLTTSSSGAGSGGALSLQGSSQTTATGCLVHSNSDMTAPAPASMATGTAEAVGSASGQITPTAQTGAPNIPDPFASLNPQHSPDPQSARPAL